MESSSSRLDSNPRPSRIPIRKATPKASRNLSSSTPSTPSASSRLPTLPPELITDIFRDSNLTSTDLSSLSLVSHSHLPSIRRTLFREITIVHSVLLKPHNQLRLTRASLTLIKYLSTHPEIASLVEGVEFRVRKRTQNHGRLYDESVRVEDGQETIERVLKLVPNLSHLSISYCFRRIADLIPFLSTHCPEISSKITSLSVWSLDEQECLELSTLFPRLRHVTTRASNPYGMFEYHLDRRMSRTLSQLTNLGNPSMPEFIPFLLSSSKSLKSLSTHFDNLRELDLKELFPNLKELYVTTTTELPWPERGYDPPSDIIFLFRQIQHSPSLETLILRGPYEELPPRPNPEDYPDFWGEEEDRIPSRYNILRAKNVENLKRIVLEGNVNGMRVEQVLAFPMERLREFVLPREGVEELEEIREIVKGKNRGLVELKWSANDPIDQRHFIGGTEEFRSSG